MKRGFYEPKPYFEILWMFFLLILVYGLLEHYAKNYPFISFTIIGWILSQFAFLGHNFFHRASFRNKKWDTIFHSFTFCFLNGISMTKWPRCHERHHFKPNVFGCDPDVKSFPHVLA